MCQGNCSSTVDGIDFYVSDAFGEGLYNSCKDVKFGTMNTRAIQFIGAGARNFKGELYFYICSVISLSLSLYFYFYFFMRNNSIVY